MARGAGQQAAGAGGCPKTRHDSRVRQHAGHGKGVLSAKMPNDIWQSLLGTNFFFLVIGGDAFESLLVSGLARGPLSWLLSESSTLAVQGCGGAAPAHSGAAGGPPPSALHGA